MNLAYRIEFVLLSQIEGMHFNFHRPEGIEFKPTTDRCLRFTLLSANPDDPFGHRNGLEFKAYATYPATEQQVLFVGDYIRNKMLRLADNISLPFKPTGETLIAEDGTFKKCFHPRRYLCPPDISQLIERVESELASEANRFLKLLRWRQKADAPAEIIKHRTLYWKVNEGNIYDLAPLDGDPSQEIALKSKCAMHWDEEDVTSMQELWSVNELVEPLGHELLREAFALANESPRSSILIMASALETAVKMHISNIAPDTAWLLEEISSPPIHKILRHYIPEIHRFQDNNIDFWDKAKPLFSKVENLYKIRNKVAHTGKIPVDAVPVRENLELVSDLLYLLDVLDGHEWAKCLVSPALRRKLDWPDSKHGGFGMIIKIPY